MNRAERPLAGLTVLDLTQHVAGPFATRLLAAYGADVIKMERPDGGDPARRTGPFPGDAPHPERSASFLYLNTGKQSVTLNLKSRAGRALLLELAEQADALVENFSPRVLPALGLDWPALYAVNPALAMVSISNYGQSGPNRDFAATNLTLFAAGGQMSLTGEPGREPLVNGGTQALLQAGLHGFSATLAAIFGARTQGSGTHIDVSIQEVQAAALEGAGPSALVYGFDATRAGNLPRATWGIYPCADGFIGCSCMDQNVPDLFRAMGREDLLDSPFRDQRWRAEHNEEVMTLLLGFFVEHTQAELRELGARHRVAIGVMPTIVELLAWPGLLEKGFWQELDHPEAGRLTYSGAPFTIDGSGFALAPAPLLGEHTEAVLRERLGLSTAEIGELREHGVI
ncbi:MAG TPA: CoA transferase [Dehalococcoidia bacterium]|nr:CoA transferase [Dehalococcoidia bacterium]